MDRVRFGRALGFGARQAIKTLVSAVDAATSDSPSVSKTAPSQSSRTSAGLPQTVTSARKTAPSPAKTSGPSTTQTGQAKQQIGGGSKRLGQAVWEPFVRLSGVLWLEVTGVFFGLFALVALGFLWKLRYAWRPGASVNASRHSLFGAAIMFALFGYFCVSSFVRAHRRERRRR